MSDRKLGNFPVDWQDARRTTRFTKVTRDDALNMISGEKTPVLLSFRASNEFVHFGEMVIPAGGIGPRQTEYDSHKGEAVFYVKNGKATFLMEKDGEVFEVAASEYMFVPANTRYKCINYTGEVVTLVFIVAPNL
jgi:Cupin domain.